MHIEILSTEIIKPSNPTPSNKQILQSSLLDKLSPHIYNRVIFFYLPKPPLNPNYTPSKIPNLLKLSLSKTLTTYYPFAGRLNPDGQINCNDKGIEFYLCNSKSKLSDILRQPEFEPISELLLPMSGHEALNGSYIDSLVKIQITQFNCGGISIGGCFSHKIADASSIATFMKDWSFVTCNASYVPCPKFNGPQYFPIYDDMKMLPRMLSADKNCFTRRIVFNMSKINSLLRDNDKSLTRFEIVSGLICKSILSACASLCRKRPELLNVIVNLRQRMKPVLLENHIGNFAVHNLVEIGENEIGLYGLVSGVKEGMLKFSEEFVKDQELGTERSLQVYESYKKLDTLVCDQNAEMILISSWCRFPFYEVDFGFGKPSWVKICVNPTKNCLFLCDARDGDDIEAWVSLEDEIMEIFEHDKELLVFSCVNPCPL